VTAIEHRIPVERLINATPERFDLAALLAGTATGPVSGGAS
jgi:hypothetical protein